MTSSGKSGIDTVEVPRCYLDQFHYDDMSGDNPTISNTTSKTVQNNGDIILSTFDAEPLEFHQAQISLESTDCPIGIFNNCFKNTLNSNLIENLIRDPYNVISEISPRIHEIHNKLEHLYNRSKPHYPEHNPMIIGLKFCLENLTEFIYGFVKQVTIRIGKADIIIPFHNLKHYQMLCHLNVCINVLSSMFYLVRAMINVKTPDKRFNSLRNLILNSFSSLDLNQDEVLKFAKLMNIKTGQFHEANDTMESLISVLQTTDFEGFQPIQNNLVFYITSTDSFFQVDDKFNIHGRPDMFVQIDMFKPKYLMIDSGELAVYVDYLNSQNQTNQIFQSLDLESPQQKYDNIKTLKVRDTTYKLYGLILHSNTNHFKSAFITNYNITDTQNSQHPEVYRVLDDMWQRKSTKETTHLNSNYQKSLNIYVRIDI
jgi:hypothetical protein